MAEEQEAVGIRIAKVRQRLEEVDQRLTFLKKAVKSMANVNLKHRYLMNRLETTWQDDSELGPYFKKMDEHMLHSLSDKRVAYEQERDALKAEQHDLEQKLQRLFAERAFMKY